MTATGLLTNKVYADGSRIGYTYTEGGLLATRVWSRGVTTAYSYDALGQLININYSDATPDVAFAYDRMGNMVSAITAVSSNFFEYAGPDLVGEVQDGVAITRSYDGLGRPAGFALDGDYAVSYGYDAFGRFASVSSSVSPASLAVQYARLPGSDLVSGYTADPLAVTKTYEPNRDLIAAVSNHVNPVNPVLISAYDYVNDAAGRRVSRNADAFGYNARSEVTSAAIGTNGYAYAYDPIGNRVWSAMNTLTNTYTANSLNQYTLISNPVNPVQILPTYDADGNMRWDGRMYHTWDAENRLIQSGPYGIATNGAVRTYNRYDHMSRLVESGVEVLSGRGAGYPLDPSQPGSWDAVETRRYVWDGYNIAAEIVIDEVTPSTNVTYYTWGLDLSGTLQGAGGVGGLLAVIRSDGTFFPCYDANGNVTDYVDAAGNIRAHYEYSPFGEIFAQSGDMADTFTHRFSTKPFDVTTGKIHYELRPYDSPLGRWMNRDPIGERGFQLLVPEALVEADIESVLRALVTTFDNAAGYSSDDTYIDAIPNIYLFVFNAPINLKDRLGLNITLETGNHAPWLQFLNNLVHQQICVDVWKEDFICTENNKWECCHKGKTCFSFGKIEGTSGMQTPQFSRTWLGWNSIVIGAVLKGEIYETDPIAGASVNGTHVTTMKQDSNWLIYMRNRSGTQDAYSVGNHNCRRYSQWEFRDASKHW